ncbi:MAG: hypothetical protein ACRDRW_00770 [Pseudonocardiaceae bacterium]
MRAPSGRRAEPARRRTPAAATDVRTSGAAHLVEDAAMAAGGELSAPEVLPASLTPPSHHACTDCACWSSAYERVLLGGI